MKLLIENLKWIGLFLVVLALTNYLTCTHYEGLSRKDKKSQKATLDSLHKSFLVQEINHLTNLEKRRVLHEEDSVLLAAYVVKAGKDASLIQQQGRTITKYNNTTSTVIIEKIDSAYKTEHPVDLLKIDSIFQIAKSRLSYCAGKIDEVNILEQRVEQKNGMLLLANERVLNRDTQIQTYKADSADFKKQLRIKFQEDSVKNILAKDVEAKNKSLKKQNVGLKVAIVVLVAGTIYSWTQ